MTKPMINRALGERNAMAQKARMEREAALLQRYWRIEMKRPEVSVWAAYDEAEKRYVVRSNLINGAPPKTPKAHRHIR